MFRHIDTQPCLGERPSLSPDARARLMSQVPEEDKEWFCWDKHHWDSLPEEAFDVLSDVEKVELWFSVGVATRLEDRLRKEPSFALIERVRRCLCYYGVKDDWNILVPFYHSIMTFNFNEPDFSSFIDFPWAQQGFGTGNYSKRWLDGGFAYILYYKSTEVGRIGFSVSRHGLFIQQAQANQVKGNRWMYRLGGRFLDVAVRKLADHFKCAAWIVDGTTQVAYLRRIHPSEIPFLQEEQDRIRGLYDSPIEGFVRTGEVVETGAFDLNGSRKYRRIERL